MIKKLMEMQKKRITLLARVLSLVLAAATVALLLITPDAANNTDQWDLRNFTDGIIIKDKLGNVIPPGGNTIVGEEYILSVSFLETPSMQFAYNSASPPRMIYKLNNDISLIAAVTNGPIYGPGATKPVIGHYNATAGPGGTVSVWFDNVNENGVPVAANFIDYYTNAHFTIDFTAKFTKTGGPQEFDFGNGVIITITVNPIEAYPEIKKGGTAFNAANNTIGYTVTVTARDDDLKIATFSDWAQKTGTGGNQNIGTLPSPAYLTLSSVVVKNNGTVVPSSQYSIAWKTGSNPPEFEIVFSGGGITIAKDKAMTVDYTFNLTNFLTVNNILSGVSYNFNIYNEATITYKDTNGNNKSAKATRNVAVKKNFITKSGSFVRPVPTATPGTITWTVRFGDGVMDLQGATVTDTLGAGFAASDRPASVNLSLYNASNVLISGPTSVATTLGTGTAFSVTIPSGTPAYYATITFTTPVSTAGTYGNTVTVTTPSGTSSATGTVKVDNPGIALPTATKTVAYKGENTLHYEIVIIIPDSQKGRTVNITDSMCIWPTSSAYNEFRPIATPENVEMTINGEPYNILSYGYRWSGTTPGTYLPAEAPPAPYKISHTGLSGAVSPEPGYPSGKGTWSLIFGTNAGGGANGFPNDPAIVGDTVIRLSYDIPLSSPLEGYNPGWEASSGWDKIPAEYRTLGAYLKNYPTSEVNNRLTINYYDPNVSPASLNVDARIGWPIFKNLEPVEVVERPDGTYFLYKVILNPGGKSGTSSNVKNRFWLFDANLPAMFYDTFDDRLEYVDGTFHMYTRNGSLVGDPPWGSGLPMNIFKLDNAQVNGAIDQPGWPWASGKDVTITGGNKLSFNLRDLSSGGYLNDPANLYTYTVSYWLKLKNSVRATLLDPIDLTNTARIEASSSTHQGNFSNDSTITYFRKPISKTLDEDNTKGNVASFDIIVNPNGVKIDGGANLCITDKMNPAMASFLTSIEAYTETNLRAGDFDLLNPKTLTKTLVLDPTTAWTWATTGENEFTIVIPDSLPVLIKYNALIKGTPGSSVTVENYVEVSGKYYDEYKDSWKVANTAATGGGKFGKFLLEKKDATDDSRALQGARFALYIGWAPSWPGSAYGGDPAPTPPAGVPATFTNGGYTYYYLATDFTGSGGSIVFDNKWLTAASTVEGAKYAVREIAAPTGYDLPANPVTIVELFSNEETDTVTVLNTPKVTTAQINGSKAIQGSPPSGQRPSTFTFHLVQVTDETGNNPVFPVTTQNRQTTTTTGTGGSFSFSLTNLGPGTYYYMITEAGPAPTNWDYAETVYIARVVVTPDGSGNPVAAVTYRNKPGPSGTWSAWTSPGAGSAAFTNRYMTTDTPPTPVKISINVKKTVSATTGSIPGGSHEFEMTLYDSDSSGNQGSPKETVKVTRDSSNPAPIAYFPAIEYKTAGTYYYLVKETSAPSGWSMDATLYHIRVKVELDSESNSFVLTVDYRKGMGGTWTPYSATYNPAGTTPSTVSGAVGTTASYTMFSKLPRDSDSGKDEFPKEYKLTDLPHCTMKLSGDPDSRDGKESALLNALYPTNTSLTTADFNMLFGTNVSNGGHYHITTPQPCDTHPRRDFIRAAAYLYEAEIKYSPTFNLWSTDAPPTAGSWVSSVPAVTQLQTYYQQLHLYLTSQHPYSQNPLDADTDLKKLHHFFNNMAEIISQHEAGTTTSLSMTYTPDNASSGKITFDHVGWVSADMAGIKQYDTKLKWTGTPTVKVGSTTYSTCPAGGAPVKKNQTIEVTGITGAVAFTLTDDAKYVKANSIKGALYEATPAVTTVSTGGDKEFLIGVAQFVKLSNTLTVSGSSGPQSGTPSQELAEDAHYVNPEATFTYIQTANHSNTLWCGDMNIQDLSLTFHNTYGATPTTGDLDLKKVCTGTGFDANKDFTFKVTFSGAGLNFSGVLLGGSAFTNGGTVTLKHNQTAHFTNIPTGATYTVVETDASAQGYTAVGGLTKTGTVTANGGNPVEVTYTNTYADSLGTLDLKKVCTGEGFDPNKDFTFKVTFSGAGLDFSGVLLNGSAFTNGSNVTLKHNQHAVFTKIPAGATYTIVENSYTSDGYTSDKPSNTVTGTITGGGTSGGGTAFTVTTGEEQRLGFTPVAYTTTPFYPNNEAVTANAVFYDEQSVQNQCRYFYMCNGTTSIVVIGAAYCIDWCRPASSSKQYYTQYDWNAFAALYSAPSGPPDYKAGGGEYEEMLWVLRNGFLSSTKRTTSGWGAGSTNLSKLQAMPGMPATLTMDEAYCATQLAIWSFSNSLKLKAPNGTNPLTIRDQRIYDAYTVLTNAAKAAKNAGEIITQPELRVALDASAATLSGSWYGPVKVNVSVLPVDFVDLSTLNVTLTAAAGMTVSATASGGTATLTRKDGETFFVNVGSVSLTGSVTMATASVTGTYSVKDVCVFCPNIPDNATGTPDWSNENEQPRGGVCWINRALNYSNLATLCFGGSEEVTFTNNYVPPVGDLDLKKVCTGTGFDADKDFTFKVTFSGAGLNFSGILLNGSAFTNGSNVTLKHNQTASFTKVPIGATYTIVETDASAQGYTAVGGLTKTGTVTANGGNPVEVTYTNNYEAGKLDLKKICTGTGFDANKEFTFKVTFSGAGLNFSGVLLGGSAFTNGGNVTLKHNQTANFTMIPIGATYTIVETDASGQGYTAVGGLTQTGTVTANGGNPVQVTYTNNYVSGSLTLKKVCEGAGFDPNKSFDFTVTFTGPGIGSIKKGGSAFTSGSTVTLKHNETVTFTDIPFGTGYSIVEADYTADRYTLTGGPVTRTGTVTSTSANVTVTYTNRFNPLAEIDIPGDKTISAGAPGTEEFHFLLQEVDEQGNDLSPKPPPFTAQVTGAGSFSFHVTGLDVGVHWFKMTEVKGTDPGWTYDLTEYLFKVTVTRGGDGSLTASLGNRQQTVNATWTHTKPDPLVPYFLDSNPTQSYNITINPMYSAGGINTCFEVRIGDESTPILHYGICGHPEKAPSGGEFVYDSDRDNTRSALVCALANSFGGTHLSLTEFNKLFDTNYTNDVEDRFYWVMQHLGWLYEAMRAHPAIVFDILDFDTWPSTGLFAATWDIADWGRWTEYEKILTQIEGMMAEYENPANPGPAVTNMSLQYNPGTGKLTIGYSGFEPAKYYTKLSWSGGNGDLSVDINGTVYTDNAKTVSVTKAEWDKITVTYTGSGAVTFTLADEQIYLKKDSIRGDLLRHRTDAGDLQPVLIGHAEFGTLECELEIGGEDDEQDFCFDNQYGTPFEFKKINREGEALDGVEFALFKCGNTSPSHTHDLQYDGTAGTCWGVTPFREATSSDPGGIVDFGLLSNGDYMLVETKTKRTYQLPFGQWLVHVDVSATPKITIQACGETPPPAFAPDEEFGYTVINYQYLTMPRAGSLTGLLATGGGVVMVGLSGILLATRRRKRRK